MIACAKIGKRVMWGKDKKKAKKTLKKSLKVNNAGMKC